ncbi:MAG: tRNA (guanosine(37)-N1)-methyltransferase TrmD [Lautropia sp.]|nr:tRNA (guanosine(37)-N1)-methyltransferase TrmD [Lautropia sp.]
MDFEVISVFPELIAGVLPFGVTGRALNEQRYRVRCWNPRDVTTDNYRRVDDRPYGGGPGMVMMAEPLGRCLEGIRRTRAQEGRPDLRVACLSPQGTPLSQQKAQALSEGPGLILLCGRYEAIDQRFLDAEVDEEISIGDFVVSGGELPALLLIDAVVRLLPGVLHDAESATQDSFVDGLLDCPHYTRPESVDGVPVPSVLLSGNHRDIDRWRRRQSVLATLRKRPDLLEKARQEGRLTAEDFRDLEDGLY